jgi:hypothetical protein
MIALTACFGLEAYQWDIKNVFVNAEYMDKEIYI